MVGSGVLLECLDEPEVTSVLVIGRSSCGRSHSKLKEVIHRDFFNPEPLRKHLNNLDACFFCLGVSAVGKSEESYHHLTFDLTVGVAELLRECSPSATFCYVTGEGTDSSETGRMMWARVKGKTENRLLNMGFGGAYMFRPGFIQPERGVKSRTRLYKMIYVFGRLLYPILQRVAPDRVTTTVILGRAMIEVALRGSPNSILEIKDINRLGTRFER